MDKIPEIKLINKRKDLINISANVFDSRDKKLKTLEDIDNNLIYDCYIMHKKKNDLKVSVFCDYFCVSSDHFQTNLAKMLALNFFNNCKTQGIRHIYGSFYNIKAVSLLKNNFDAKIGK